jgi:acetyl-CoA C-acetyltransferase
VSFSRASSQAWIAGAYEHPTRYAPELSTVELHRACAAGALADAGLGFADVDGYFGGRDVPGFNLSWFIDYLNIRPRVIDATDTGGCSPLAHLSHAADALASGRCNVALITLAGRPRSEGMRTGTAARPGEPERPDSPWELPYRQTITTLYAMMTARHMYEYGTTAEQLAWVRVHASTHAQHNPHAMYRQPVDLQQVLDSPVIAPPLRRLDCCVISDGGGALVVTRKEIARELARPGVRLIGAGHALYGSGGGRFSLTTSGASLSGPMAFEQAGVKQTDIQYASIYDNFTVMVLMQLEDLGFCAKGTAGRFVQDGQILAGQGKLPINTDGGGQCNNHPTNRGGITKIIEAVRQLRGEAHPAMQVPNCGLALACGPGGSVGSGHAHATVILERV